MSDFNISNLALINHIRDKLSNLSSTEKLVALILASRRNSHTLKCNPSHGTIAKDCSISRRTSINAINSLVKKKVISRYYDKFKSNHYFFYFDAEKVLEISGNNDACIFSEKEILHHLQK